MGPGLATASDLELLASARAGDGAAFAILLRRHAERFAPLADTVDGERALLRVGVRAMRALPSLDPRTAVGDWLGSLADEAVRRHGVDPSDAAVVDPADGERDWIDRWWTALDLRWPTGRRRLRLPSWLRLIVAGAVIVLVGVVTTTAILRERPPPPVIAQVQAYAEPERGDDFEFEDGASLDDLPVFELPEDPAEPSPAPPPVPAPPDPGEPTEPDAPADPDAGAIDAEPGA